VLSRSNVNRKHPALIGSLFIIIRNFPEFFKNAKVNSLVSPNYSIGLQPNTDFVSRYRKLSADGGVSQVVPKPEIKAGKIAAAH
jgi:hypothetical protein